MSDSPAVKNHAAFIWSVADLLRGDYKQSEYGRVILPLTVLRRFDCVLEPTKPAVLAKHAELQGKVANMDPILSKVCGHGYFNTSPFDLTKLLDDPDNVGANLRQYIAGFSSGAAEVMHRFGFDTQITRLDRSKLLYQVVAKFCAIDLHPDVVSNNEMGYVYEELIRRFSEQSNETAGEHFTPREVIRLMVSLLFRGDADVLAKPGTVRTMADPACGTGGMLSVAQAYLRELNPDAELRVSGQELNDETYATCRADMMLKSPDRKVNIYPGNSFTEDGLAGERFDYLLANPPFGVEWKKVADPVRDEHDTLGFNGRFGAGLPRINDGSLLFLQHMISKMKAPADGGTRLAIVFNGSPLFTGAAGSGESEIRRWIIEHDWLEAVVALPDQLFYNTGISTYFWVVTNRKTLDRRGKVQLLDARELFVKMRKSLGEKRKQISDGQIDEIVSLYAAFTESDRVKIFPNESFGFQRITVERPLRLRWSIDESTLAVLASVKPVARLDSPARDAFLAAVGALAPLDTTSRDSARSAVRPLLAAAGLKGVPAEKAVLEALSMRDPSAPEVTGRGGEVESDPDQRDQENVPFPEGTPVFEEDVSERLAAPGFRDAVETYVKAEVLPWVPDAWVDHSRTKVGYEIPLTRHFYKYVPPRPLEEIDAEIKALEAEIQALLREVVD